LRRPPAGEIVVVVRSVAVLGGRNGGVVLSATTSTQPQAPPQRVWFEDPPEESNIVLVGGQAPQARLRAKFQLYSYRVDDKPGTPREKFVLVALDGSTVHPGTMLFNQADKRGFYTESVQVTMRFLDSSALVIRDDQPKASEEDGSVSNSISLSLGGGFFGETPTGSAGASIGNTITESLPDFEFVNDTVGDTVNHTARLRLVGKNAYRHPPDLVDPSSLTDVLSDLPPRAVSNMPLISQALFHAPNGLTTSETLRIELTHRLMCVEKTLAPWELLRIGGPGNQVVYDANRPNERQQVHVADLHLDIDPLVAPYAWEFEVPFGAVL
jgi:hypothetical protein